MPNWCFTEYTFVGNKNELEMLRSKVLEWTSRDYMENGFGHSWLGNIVCGAGYRDNIDNKECYTINCRGTLDSIGDVESITINEKQQYRLSVYTETAWGPMGLMWQKVIEALKLSTVQFTYYAEETGNGVYETYDPANLQIFCYDYVLNYDLCDEPEGFQRQHPDCDMCGVYPLSEKEAVKQLQYILDTSETNIEALIEMCRDVAWKNTSSYLNIFSVYKSTELR